jgi:hypothetical protein
MACHIMYKPMILSHQQLTELLHYDPMTGIFTWLPRRIRAATARTDNGWNTRNAGKIAGSIGHLGYLRIVLTIDGRVHYVPSHRLAWFYVTRTWPHTDIDHINMDVIDNRFSNLRLATRSQNNANAKPPRDNKSGKKGVSFDSTRKLWKVEICRNGERFNLGRFADFEEACEVRRRKAIDLFGEFARED